MTSQKSLEVRVSALERLIGTNGSISGEKETSLADPGAEPGSAPAAAKAADLEHRLTAIETLYKLTTSSSFNSVWNESEKLLQELHPGDYLTHQQLSSRNYPIVYRRAEVLASADRLRRDMKQLEVILNTLLISQSGSRVKIREEQVTQAPVLTEVSVRDEDVSRLDAISAQLGDVQQRTGALSARVDTLIERYHSAMTSLSEKLVLLDEQIKTKAAKK